MKKGEKRKMTRTELVKAYAKTTEQGQAVAKKQLDTLEAIVFEAAKTDDGVKLFDGVTIYSKIVEEAVKRNPATSEKIVVPKHRAIKAKFGKKAKEAVYSAI